MSIHSSILLCPGQGAQSVGMGKSWASVSASARSIFEQADKVLGFPLGALCFEGPDTQLNRTDIAQAAIYTTSIACCRGLIEQGKLDEKNVIATAGLSLGEFTALHLAGAFDFVDGLKLVRLRGQAMQDAADAAPSSMVALIGADESQANALCDAARGDDVLVPANFNCPGQIVISGSKSACDRAVAKASEMGINAKALVVAGAFHSPLMKPAADRLAAALEQVQWNQPHVPVVSNVTARPHTSTDINSIKARLVEQLTSPVRWSESMQWVISESTTKQGKLIELAPGKVLSGLMRRIDKQAKVENHAEPGA